TGRNGIARINSDGSLDSSFDPGSGANNEVDGIAVQDDGKILIGGLFTTYNGTARNRIARINSDGSLDPSFDPGSGANNPVFSLALQPDSKVLVVGQFTSFNGTSVKRIARLNSETLVNWADGDSASKTISVTIVDDSLTEANEQFSLT